MRLSLADARALAARAIQLAAADETEALVASSTTALTRFADNRIHQNVAEADTHVSIRTVLGTRVGVASTNRTDDESLVRCAAAALEIARHAPEDPAFPGLPTARRISPVNRVSAATRAFDADRRARAAAAIIEQSVERGFTAAGTVATSDQAVAIANSHGVDAAMETTDLRATVLSTGDGGGSGWASFLSADADAFSPEALGDQAATTASRAANPASLEPGSYAVVLAPEAVSDILDFLGYVGFGAKAFAEGSSFLVGHVGDRVLDERITIRDDALSAETVGLAFDFEGQPKGPTSLISAGVASGPVTDSYYASTLRLPNTGHALPAPNPYGPMALNLEMAAGDAGVMDMIASVKRGVYVSRFHYVNVEDPMKITLTGMTRDGTFLIENGRLTDPVRNLRFTQSAVEALSHVQAVGRECTLVGPGEGGATLVPALLLEKWAFTGQTG